MNVESVRLVLEVVFEAQDRERSRGGEKWQAFLVTILGEDRMGTFFEGQRVGYVCELTG